MHQVVAFGKRSHRITYHEFNSTSDKLVITFNPMDAGMGPRGFATDLCEKMGWNHILVGKWPRTRFCGLSLDEFQESVSPLCAGRDVICYGFSAGGYAALYYGGSVNARILSLSPRNTSHPMSFTKEEIGVVKVSGKPHPTDRFAHSESLEDCPISDTAPTILWDQRQRLDSKLVYEWAVKGYPHAHLLNVPNAGHKTAARLRNAGKLSGLLKDFVARKKILQEQLKFPNGTLDRALDDAVEAYDAREYQRALAIMSNMAVSEIFSRGIAQEYLDCLLQKGDLAEVSRIRTAIKKREINFHRLPPPWRRMIRKLFDQVHA